MSGSSVFTLKTPRSVFGHCVMQNTKYSLEIKQICLCVAIIIFNLNLQVNNEYSDSAID